MNISELFSIKYLALILLVLQNTFLVVLMRYSRHRVDENFLPLPLYAASTAVFMMEILKFIACNFVILYENSGNILLFFNQMNEEITISEVIRVSIPSLLYTVQNNLLYYALTHLDAATYQVCYQVCLLLFFFNLKSFHFYCYFN